MLPRKNMAPRGLHKFAIPQLVFWLIQPFLQGSPLCPTCMQTTDTVCATFLAVACMDVILLRGLIIFTFLSCNKVITSQAVWKLDLISKSELFVLRYGRRH